MADYPEAFKEGIEAAIATVNNIGMVIRFIGTSGTHSFFILHTESLIKEIFEEILRFIYCLRRSLYFADAVARTL